MRRKDTFAEQVLARVKPGAAFRPVVTYDPDGDCIEFLAKPDSFYAERLDNLVTVYYSHDTDEIIGSLIKGVSRFIKEVVEKYPGFLIEVQGGRVLLQHLFLARLWSSPPAKGKVPIRIYKKLAEVAAQSNVEAILSSA